MEFRNIHLAIIGCGKWGINHVKTAFEILGDNLKIVCDTDPSSKNKINSINDRIKFSTNLNDVISSKEINAVIVSTPAETHYKVALACLEKGKNVLVEKPITLVSTEAKHLLQVAESKK